MAGPLSASVLRRVVGAALPWFGARGEEPRLSIDRGTDPIRLENTAWVFDLDHGPQIQWLE